MEAIPVGIPNQNIARVRNVDAVREVGQIFAADPAQIMTILTEHDHIMSFEVTNVKFFA